MVRRLDEARVGRTKSVYVSQEYVPSYGWEDITVYDDVSPESLRLAKQDVKDYKDNGYNARYITRKLNNPDYVEPIYELSEEAVIDWLENECPYEYEIKDGTFGKWVRIGTDVSISLPDDPESVFDNSIKITDNYERRTYRVNTLDELKKKVDRILKKREKIKADLIAAGYGNFVESTKVSGKKSIKEATKMSSLEALCEQINNKMPPKEGEYFIESIGYGSGKYRLSVLYPENGGVDPVSPAMTKRELESALQTVVEVCRRSLR